MAIWKEQNTAKKDQGSSNPSFASTPEPAKFDAPSISDIHPGTSSAPAAAPARAVERESKESLIASDITIEGKIEGSGNVRIAGRFKGDVNVKGNLTIEAGAKLTGGVRASKVTIAGELEGNVESAQRVELLEAGVLIGDVKAGTLTVAAGSRMRGQMECGWEDKPTKSSDTKTENGAAS
jgi:cytoskeletal protein CcmA (bactofilin family)